MPHYADGSPAQLGDVVMGKPYNTPEVIVGKIVSITPGVESCNCQVAFLELIENFTEFIAKQPSPIVFAKAQRNNGDGTWTTVGLLPRTDYGETRAFRKIEPAVAAALPQADGDPRQPSAT
jgi:hypothetical protein